MESADANSRLDLLYREHGRMVVAICGALLRDRHEAEDAAQQSFLSAYRSLLNGTVPRDPGAWLAVIARNECRGRGRALRCVPSAEGRMDGTGSDPPLDVIRRAEIGMLWEAIAELPPLQRKALLLREVRGFSYDQLSDDLALSRPSVRSLLNRARQRVRLRLEDGFAALGGVSWLESLLRLFGGASGTAGPAVTRAAAAGLGAAALAGGAVMAPDLVRHASQPTPRAAPARTHPGIPIPAAATPRAVPPSRLPATRTRPAAGHSSPARHERHRHGGADGSSAAQGSGSPVIEIADVSGGSQSSGKDGGRTDGGTPTPTGAETSGRDGGSRTLTDTAVSGGSDSLSDGSSSLMTTTSSGDGSASDGTRSDGTGSESTASGESLTTTTTTTTTGTTTTSDGSGSGSSGDGSSSPSGSD